jgi:hypothetical protein
MKIGRMPCSWIVLGTLIAGCGQTNHTLPVMPGSATRNALSAGAPAAKPHKGAPTVFWTLDGASGVSEVQFANAPLRARSKVTTIDSNANNMLVFSSDMRFDAEGRMWIYTFGRYGGNPGSVYVFDLPLTKESRPRYEFVLQGTNGLSHMTFDAYGNLWVTGGTQCCTAVLEYTGPFDKSGTLLPAITLTKGIRNPWGLAFDKSGNFYVSNSASDAKHSIAVFTAPISNRQPYFLTGLQRPGGVIFDAAGNLYASDNSTSLSAIVRYDSDHLEAGAQPDIVDRTGLHGTYEENFAFTSGGDLYFSNCGTHASVYWYPTGKKPFTATLAPSLNYTNRNIDSVACVWGIAIK